MGRKRFPLQSGVSGAKAPAFGKGWWVIMAIKKVIIPVDGSRASENAFHAGVELAGKYGAEILLLNVVDATEMIDPINKMMISDEYRKAIKEKGEELLAALSAEIPVGTVHKEMVLIGVPGPAISNLANKEEDTAVVMGNSGKNALSSFVMGSVSHYVVHHAKGPVVIVK